ncbi:MAG: hypothetical protein SGPRY_013665, partial [Prymnesium sp.]
MAWFADAPRLGGLRPDAVSLRAREVWGTKEMEAGSVRLSADQMSYLWASPKCGERSCPMDLHRTAACLLADDQWAVVPRQHADAYFLGGAGCGSSTRAKRHLVESVRKSSRGNSTPPSAWSLDALRLVYNGEGLLTVRLLQLGVPISLAPAAIRFHPVKEGRNWYEKCIAAPCDKSNATYK